eukprot:Phypoly_transcript_04197.p1 GENE.Phypoly_transcript_04197~~Phypoly_transcript_04197.p1  ORF type:complete len:689 (+),score=102.38 Phypoly_transcript_04197:127-2193(+)
MTIKVVPLGAGQDVGRSCVLVSVGGKNIMFDCGMHMGYNDARRFPDFSYISKTGKFNTAIDCVIITHFHLDHCGALPYFTEMCGYDGPIFMTHPTKAICPILLEDYRKIMVDRKGETNFFTSQMIKNCMRKVKVVNLHQTISVDGELEIRPYYAGHVLGAAMFLARSRGESVVYTGDYNMTPDRHLGAAWIDRCRPDLLITETTYATTIRDSKRAREHAFLKRIHECVEKGGKVLIPVFALGRAQELCILIDSYWEQMGLNVPIYFAAGLTEKANLYYKLFINWTNQKIKKTFVQRNMFDFKHIRPFERSLVDAPGAMVLFATPGMLHAGLSLEVFKKWAPNELNMTIIPGYCVVGTVGNKLLTGRSQTVEIDKKTTLEVKCKVANLSFSAHADAKGIMQLLRMAEPRTVLLVHGERGKMGELKARITRELGVACFDPPNGATVTIPTHPFIPVDISRRLLKRARNPSLSKELTSSSGAGTLSSPQSMLVVQGLVTLGNKVQVVDPKEIGHDLGVGASGTNGVSAGASAGGAGASTGAHVFRFQTHIPYPPGTLRAPLTLATLHAQLAAWLPELPITLDGDAQSGGNAQASVDAQAGCVCARTLRVTLSDTMLDATWEWTDESLAMYVLCVVRKILLDFVGPTSPTLPAPTPTPLPHPSDSANTPNTTNNLNSTSNGAGQKDQLMCYE